MTTEAQIPRLVETEEEVPEGSTLSGWTLDGEFEVTALALYLTGVQFRTLLETT